jgi:hypothetical protein
MSVYSDKSLNKIDDEKQNLYNRNKVTTRSNLTDQQLDTEIELYLN